jgi:1A family penicillin-binding protein
MQPETVRDLLLGVIRPRPQLFMGAVVAFSVGIWVLIGTTVAFGYGAMKGLPGSAAVRSVGTMPRATTVVDVKGRHAFTIFQERRLHVPLAQVSPHVIRAIVAAEDQRFYRHGGFDLIRVIGAGWNNVLAGRAEQGGSTITQQLARLAFLTPDKTFRRKLQEVVVAIQLERAFSKDEILELYLNKAYFGDGLYGVEAASLGYVGKHAQDLDVADAAMIAGLVKSPSAYAPTLSPQRALARRNLVLRVMFDEGAIDQRAYDAARRQAVVVNDALRREEAYGQYFKEEVRQQLVELFGWERVSTEGLKVETTLDLDMQKAAETEVAEAVAAIEKRQRAPYRQRAATNPLQAALVAIDPHTGEVRAMVGGRAFDQSRFNRVTQAKRQPGSAFKPFVYATALERGFTPATVLSGLSEPVLTAAGEWIPQDGHVDDDALTMRSALRLSSNRAAVRMIEDVGIPATVEYAERFGMGSMPGVPSLALGSGEVTMLSLVSAYGVFANEGALVQPTLIRRVTTTSGQILYESHPTAQQVIKPVTAFLITSMLQDVINAGTGSAVRQLGFRLPAAGKTGTTNEYRDAWFVGYTPSLVTGVWVGYDQPRTIAPGGYAAQLAVPLWTRFMMSVTQEEEKAERFPTPSSVTSAAICPLSGKLATSACYGDPSISVRSEYFEHGTEPIEYCTYHLLHQAPPMTVASATMTPAPSPAAPAAAAPNTAPESVAQPNAAPAPTAPAAQPEKKRGFWGRIFGRR